MLIMKTSNNVKNENEQARETWLSCIYPMLSITPRQMYYVYIEKHTYLDIFHNSLKYSMLLFSLAFWVRKQRHRKLNDLVGLTV